MGIGKLWIPLLCLALIFGFFWMRGSLVNVQKKIEELTQSRLRLPETTAEASTPPQGESMVPTQSSPENLQESPARQENTNNFACIVQSKEEKVGIFTPQGDLIRLLDVDLRLLSPADRAKLDAGIPIFDREELIALLEDLGI